MNGKIRFGLLCLCIVSLVGAAQKPLSVVVDVLILGNNTSEKAHQLTTDFSEVITGGLNETARRLLPQPTSSWAGGKIAFTIKVDPVKQNYLSVRLWGSDVSNNRLYIVCEGKQVGYRHLGDIDMLDIGSDGGPFYNQRFFYNTSPLPLLLTKGKKEVNIEIRSQGPIWGYGATWEKYQKDMTTPGRALYKVYTHTDPAFVPHPFEIQGKAPVANFRKEPGTEVFDGLKQRVNGEIDAELASEKPLSQIQMQFLAKAYHVGWSHGYHNLKLVLKVLNSLDAIYLAYRKNPGLAESDPATYNADWFGLGITGQVLFLLQEPLRENLKDTIVGVTINRRQAFEEMLLQCRDWHRRHRRMYTNQSMINDLYGIYYANKGLQNIQSHKAMLEKDVLHYLYESVGLLPWSGSEDSVGNPGWEAGKDYWLLTQKGLTKELGYVGNYGEVLDWVSEIYEATKPALDQPGDAIIKAQIEKIALARAPFRYPTVDDDGYQTMRMATVVGWRDTHYPGDVTYAQRPSWDGSPLQIVAATLHPQLVGYAQQMFDEHQFFSSIEQKMKEKQFRVTAGLLPVPDEYELVKKQPKSSFRLPMSWDQPDFVYSDEEDGVVAIKNGKEILYASLYWRARFAINNLARVQLVTPTYNNIATVRIKEDFDASGLEYTRPDHTNLGFGNGGLKYPDGLQSAHAGEKLPVAKIPEGTPYKLGNENAYAGRANYYQMQYGKYIIAMNATKEKIYELKVPDNFSGALNIATGKSIGKTKSIKVAPMKTIVLYK